MFNEKEIVLTFASMSDVHITGTANYDSDEKFANAIKYNNEIAKRDGTKIDAFVFCGDMLDRGWESLSERFARIFKENIEPGQKIFYAIGNHEHISSPNGEIPIRCIRQYLGEEFFDLDLGTREEFDKGLRKCVINGYTFIALMAENWNAPGPNKYTKERLDFLENALEEAKQRDSEKYVFVLNHSMAYGTCYGSDLDGIDSMWNTSELTPILKKYPNAILIGGHLHFPLNDERSIMQTDFTTMGDGCVTYMAIEAGGYEDMMFRTVMRDAIQFSQNLLIELDKEGNCRIRRIDCYNKDEIKIPWELDAPKKGTDFLNKYTFARGDEKHNKAPEMNGKCYLGERINKDGDNVVTITFDSGCDDDFVHRYVVTYYENDVKVGEKKILADFYKHPHPKDMKKSYSLDLCKKVDGVKYKASVKAIDSWDKESNTIYTE